MSNQKASVILHFCHWFPTFLAFWALHSQAMSTQIPYHRFHMCSSTKHYLVLRLSYLIPEEVKVSNISEDILFLFLVSHFAYHLA